MPFTPFHFGLGVLGKAVRPARFSLSAFVMTQVLIDAEVLYFILRNEYPMHRALHSLWGGLLAGLVVALGLLVVRRFLPPAWSSLPLISRDLSTTSLFIGGIFGGLSHSMLDNIMHRDVLPLYPFEAQSGLHGIVSADVLHIGLTLCGIAGILILSVRALSRMHPKRKDR
jgi:membrane-bound metal-dependent hydrolase YbcI (DUF457 family)